MQTRQRENLTEGKHWTILWPTLAVSLCVSAHFSLWKQPCGLQSWESSTSRNAKYGRISLLKCVCVCVCVCCDWCGCSLPVPTCVCIYATACESLTGQVWPARCTWGCSSGYWKPLYVTRRQWRTPQHACVCVCVCVCVWEILDVTERRWQWAESGGHAGVTLT